MYSVSENASGERTEFRFVGSDRFLQVNMIRDLEMGEVCDNFFGDGISYRVDRKVSFSRKRAEQTGKPDRSYVLREVENGK